FGSTEFHVVRAGPHILGDWLHLILRSKQVRENAKHAMQGAAGQQRVPVGFLEQLEIPIPPIPEQRRLVTRIEELRTRAQELRALNVSLVEDATRLLAAEYNRICLGAPIRPFGRVAKLVRRRVESSLDENYQETGIR